MKIDMLIGAALAVLLVGVTATFASHQPDLFHQAISLVADGHMSMALGAVPAVASHALIDTARSPLVYARPRGLVLAPRMDASGADKIMAELQKAFSEFKSSNDKDIADLKKGMGDVVQTEKVDRINASITELQGALNDINATIAGLKVGGAGDGKSTPEQREYAKAFDRFFRRGVENGLNDLAVKAAMRTDSDPDGGYIVPPEMDAEISRVLSTVSVMRQLATVRPISTGMYKKPVNLGGTDSGWVGERETRTETNTSTLSLLEFPVMELYANPAATQTFLDDASVDVGAWLGSEVDIVFAEQEGAAFISGNGVNRPRGLLGYTAIANASYAWGKLGYIASGVAAAISDASNNGVDRLIDLSHGALKQGYRTNATWLMNRFTAAGIRKLKDAYGQYLWQPAVQAGMLPTLLGYPQADDDNMSDIGANAYPIAFGDFKRGYLIVDRVGTRVLRDPYTNKPYVMFYTTKRVGGGVQNFEAIKLLKIAVS